jgi:hypothetical protein
MIGHSPSESMIDQNAAVRIANDYAKLQGLGRVRTAMRLKEESSMRLRIYWPHEMPLEECWICGVDRIRQDFHLRSGIVIVLSPDEGRILYAGSDGDEG